MSLLGSITSTRRRRITSSILVAVIAAAGMAAAVTPAAAAGGVTTCRDVSVPVTEAGQSGYIAGTLCVPTGATAVQLLVHGWTYDRYYWDLPYEPDTYSYVRAANRDGYATLDIDRLGDGQSSHPLSAFDTFYGDVNTVHQVVQALRAGQLGQSFGKVIEVGHSLGSMITLTEAGAYQDVDAIITTGMTHSINYGNVVSKVLGDDYPAIADEKFTSSGLDAGYLTSDPGTRGDFYNAPATDPNVVATDEQLKQTGDLVEAATLLTYNLANADHTLNIPVDDVVGQDDLLICGLLGPTCSSSAALASFERPFYGPNATVVGYLVPGAGHDLQLEKSAPTTDAQMLAFSDQYIGHGDGATGTAPGSAAPAPTPPTPAPSVAAQLVNQVVTNALVPALNAIHQASGVVPGLGSNTDPIPDMSALLAPVGNLVDQLVGTFPEGTIGGA